MFTMKQPSAGDLKNIIKIYGGKLDKHSISVDTNPIKDSTDHFSDLTIEDGGQLQICPPDSGRICSFICGPSGSGKSYWCSKFLKEYKNKFPDNPIVLISPISDDKILNRHNPLKISISDENFIEEDSKLTLNELKDSLVIFDDICAITDKILKQGVQNLASKILLTGRHFNITCLCTEHILLLSNNYIKNVINESSTITIYPKSGSSYHIKRVLNTYCGMSNKDISKILALPSRSVTIYRSYPAFVVANDTCYMVHKNK